MATKTNCLLFVSAVWSACNFVHCFLDIEELQSVHYGIDILREPVVSGKDEPAGAVYLQSKYGQQYQCSFPDHSLQERQKEEKEKLAMEIGIPELLRPLETGPCLIKIKDWWTYEFCYGKHIRQYHVEEGKISGEIIFLGLFESEFDWNKEDLSAKQKNYLNRYHSQQYVNGTGCDLTQEPRRAEVRFVCEEGSGDYLSRIDEPETCVYIVTVHTTKICHHPNLKPRAHSHNVPIYCSPVISDVQYQQYLIDLEEERLIKAKEAEKVLEDDSVPDNAELTEKPRRKIFADPDEPKNPRAELHDLLSKVLTKKEDEVDEELEQQDDTQSVNDPDNVAGGDPIFSESLNTRGTDVPEAGDGTGLGETTHVENTVHEAGQDYTQPGNNQGVTDHTETPGNADRQAAAAGEGGTAGFDDEDVNMDNTEMIKKLKTVLQSKLDQVFKQTEEYLDGFDEDRDRVEGEGGVDGEQNSQQPQRDAVNDGNNRLNAKEKNPAQNEFIDKKNTDKKKDKETNELSSDDDKSERVKMRVTRMKNSDDLDDDPNDQSLQTHVVETTIQNELQKAGLDTDGGKIRVKIITAGYYDSDESSIYVLSEEDSAAFNKMIVAILGGNQEATKEAARHKELEDNYSFVWDKKDRKTKKP